MDLQSELSTVESVEENEVNPDSSFGLRENNVGSNGSYTVNEDDKLSSGNGGVGPLSQDNVRGKGVDVQPINSPPSTGVKPPAAKGYGLKKWRRIRRDSVKDGSGGVDSSKILKRGLSGSANANPIKPPQLPSIDDDGSIRSANVLKNPGVSDGLAIHSSSSDSRFARGADFAVGADSENSEDRSSKASTAATGPKIKYDLPPKLGYAWDNNRIKDSSGKILGNSVQLAKGRIEKSKKPKGDRVKIEKENSHSSLESDSRSSNFVFVQGECSATSNGKHGKQSMNDDGADSKMENDSEGQSSEEVETGYGVLNEDVSYDGLAADFSLDGKQEDIDTKGPSENKDPLKDSILTLNSLQESLENELQKFGEVGKDITLLLDPPSDEPEVLSLTKDVKLLESKLEETQHVLVAKESKISELEATLNSRKLLKGECASNTDLLKEHRQTETMFDDLFRQRIEAEVEYLAITKTMQELRVIASGHSNLVEEQIHLAGEQVQTTEKLKEVESKADVLRKEEELEKHCESIIEADEVQKMQKRTRKAGSCFLLQFCLLALVLWSLVVQLMPHSGDFVPT